MIIYNITVKVDWSIAAAWLQWIQDVQIPEIVGTGCFVKHRFLKLLQVDETEGPTYALQYYASAMSKYEDYLRLYARQFSRQAAAKWGDKYIDFHTLMEEVE